MATEKAEMSTTESDHEQMFADWVYQVPGVLLILFGFGGLTVMTLT